VSQLAPRLLICVATSRPGPLWWSCRGVSALGAGWASHARPAGPRWWS